MHVLGVKVTGHDTGAALIANGRVIAIAEERLNRIKHSPDMYPEMSIAYCLRTLGLEPKDIGLVVIDQIDDREALPVLEIFRRGSKGTFDNADIRVVNHHEAHAANAFFCSPFEDAAVMVYDGSGEKLHTHLGVPATETETLFVGRGNTLTEVKKSAHLRIGKTFPYTTGIGKMYSAITRYLNFGAHEEGKTMGLAPYGKADMFMALPERLWWTERHGAFYCNANIRFPRNISLRSKVPLLERTRTVLRIWTRRTGLKLQSYLFGKDGMTDPKLFDPLQFSRPVRDRSIELPDTYYTNIAYAVQAVLEKVLMGWAMQAKAITSQRHLCISGGLGLNSVSNKKILDQAGFDDVWIQPACSDTGLALGLALYGEHVILGRPRSWVMCNAYLGREYTDEEYRSALELFSEKVVYHKVQDIADKTAEFLAEGKIVGWFQGGSEYGPRALGHRSMLGNPAVPEMADIMNRRVKHREAWRPFAASVLLEHVSEYFDMRVASPFMLMVADVLPDKRRIIPSVTHVDGTCRLQTVTRQENGIYYELIEKFYAKTGIPMVLNTSYNLAGEPIIETPEDALKDFISTDLDYLVLGEYLVSLKGGRDGGAS